MLGTIFSQTHADDDPLRRKFQITPSVAWNEDSRMVSGTEEKPILQLKSDDQVSV
jgi:hypothetical protein